MGLAPVVGPMLGGQLLRVTDWRGHLRRARHHQRRAAPGGHVAGAGGDLAAARRRLTERLRHAARATAASAGFLLIAGLPGRGALQLHLDEPVRAARGATASDRWRSRGSSAPTPPGWSSGGQVNARLVGRHGPALMLRVGLVVLATAAVLPGRRARHHGAARPSCWCRCGSCSAASGMSFGNATALALVPHGGDRGVSLRAARHQPVPARRHGAAAALHRRHHGRRDGAARWRSPRLSPWPSASASSPRARSRIPPCPRSDRGATRDRGEGSRLPLLEATLRLAGERGYVGTTMARITRATGPSRELGLLALRQQGPADRRGRRPRLRGLARARHSVGDDGRVAPPPRPGCAPSSTPSCSAPTTASTTGGWACSSPWRPGPRSAPPRASGSSASAGWRSSGSEQWWRGARGRRRRRPPAPRRDAGTRRDWPGSPWPPSTACSWPASPTPPRTSPRRSRCWPGGLDAVAHQLATGASPATGARPTSYAHRPAAGDPRRAAAGCCARPARSRRESGYEGASISRICASGRPAGQLALLALHRQGRPARRRRRALLRTSGTPPSRPGRSPSRARRGTTELREPPRVQPGQPRRAADLPPARLPAAAPAPRGPPGGTGPVRRGPAARAPTPPASGSPPPAPPSPDLAGPTPRWP